VILHTVLAAFKVLVQPANLANLLVAYSASAWFGFALQVVGLVFKIIMLIIGTIELIRTLYAVFASKPMERWAINLPKGSADVVILPEGSLAHVGMEMQDQGSAEVLVRSRR